MLKLVYPCRRLRGLDRAEYARRILEGHVPLALRHHPGMRHYVVNLVERDPQGGPELDSFAELYFESEASYQAELYDTDEGRRIIGEDVARFLGGADQYATREFVHHDELPRPAGGGRTPGLKWLLAVRRRPDLSREDFVAHWHATHVPLVLKQLPGIRRYVTSVVERRMSETGADWDGFSELWWDDRASAREALRGGGAAVDADSARFIAEAPTWSVAEHVQK